MGTLLRVPYTLEVTHRNPGTAKIITVKQTGAAVDWYLRVKNYIKKGNKRPAPDNGWLIVQPDAGLDGSAAIPDSQLQNGEATDVAGVPGQGNSPNPRSFFPLHAIVWINRPDVAGVSQERYFDPSYGRIYLGLGDFEYRALDGVSHRIGGLDILRDITSGEIEFKENP